MKITEDRISELANRSIECIQSEQRGKKTEKKEQSLRDLWDNNKEKKKSNICIVGVPGGEGVWN